MYSKAVIAVALCVLSTVSAGVVPVAAPLAAAGFIAPYATSYNAHTVNHNIAAPYVAAAAPYIAAATPAAYSAAPVLPAAYTSTYGGAAVLPAAYTYGAATYPYLL